MTEQISWRKYQKDAASLFERLGHEVAIEAGVVGARSPHKVDVLVKGRVPGAGFLWIIECKDWKTNIPKEKIIALDGIVKDVGADRGFLLCEVGFQPGAISAAQNTNITLASLDGIVRQNLGVLHIRDSVFIRNRVKNISSRLEKLQKGRRELSSSEFVDALNLISYIDFALKDGCGGIYPTVYTVLEDGSQLSAYNWNDLYVKCNELLDSVEKNI